MSIIGDCRSKYIDEASKEVNPYWEGLLDDAAKAEIRGYDYAMENAVASFFDNIDAYEEVFKGTFDVNKVKTSVVTGPYDAYGTISEMQAPEDCNEETKIARLFKTCILHYMELERNEAITAIIDGMDDVEYERRKSNV